MDNIYLIYYIISLSSVFITRNSTKYGDKVLIVLRFYDRRTKLVLFRSDLIGERGKTKSRNNCDIDETIYFKIIEVYSLTLPYKLRCMY